jgi:hypothetical protein
MTTSFLRRAVEGGHSFSYEKLAAEGLHRRGSVDIPAVGK